MRRKIGATFPGRCSASPSVSSPTSSCAPGPPGRSRRGLALPTEPLVGPRPFLPLPARDYVRWRMYTAYGDPDAVPPVEDLIRYAHWAVRIG